MNNEPIIIIGMHRSGTSMLTSFIEDVGVYIGYKKAKVNKEAFFFQKINDWMLYQVGGTWDSPSASDYIGKEVCEKLTPIIRRKIRSLSSINFFGPSRYFKYLLTKKLAGKWGWKDPRNTLTLKIWKEIFPNAKIIHIYRNPIDVAQSLRIREEKYMKNIKFSFFTKIRIYFFSFKRMIFTSPKVINLKEGYELWKYYVTKAFEADIMFNDVIHIKYEDFLSDSQKTLLDLSKFLDVEINNELIEKIANKVDAKRAYAFKGNQELCDFYNEVKSDQIMSKLGYLNILD